MNLLDLATNAASGGLLGTAIGLVGSVATNVVAYFNQRQAHRQEMERRRLDAEIASQAHRNALERLDAQGRQDAARAAEKLDLEGERTFRAAQEAAGTQSYGYRWVEAVVGLMRPALTLAALSSWIAVSYSAGDLTLAETAAALGFQTSAAFAWWFADRRLAKANPFLRPLAPA